MGDLTDYLATLAAADRQVLTRVRDLALEVCPEAEEGRSYGMAALRLNDRPLIGVASTKSHLSLFPFSPEVVTEVADRLAGYQLSKGTIRFTAEHPLPDDVVQAVVRLRAEQIDGRRH
ncbi:iron chaperone [Nakamurella lactea]|uniref:iron chaperone n=1 Tax=Nakamurella lactea TaxID=459515 RepID=UPI000426F67D|nr:DUF1801 domain-containing protein [Nakamurella lactea]